MFDLRSRTFAYSCKIYTVFYNCEIMLLYNIGKFMDLYHVLNRGVDKRVIFEDSQDYARFVHDMFVFNDIKPVLNITRSQMSDLRSRTLVRTRVRLVDIHGWCLMNNHYHLLISEKVEGGLTLFIRKLNIGYAKYFNEKYKRDGTLFQGRTKKLLIDNDAYFLHILNYIHLNPLDISDNAKDWRERKITDAEEALQKISEYKWSSYLDYAGVKNFPSIINTSLFQDVFQNKYKESLEKYIRDLGVTEIKYLNLEK